MMGAYLAITPGKKHNIPILETTSLLGLLLILYAVFFYNDQTRFPGLAALPPCLGAALLIYSGELTYVGRVLSWKPVVFIGSISYSLYLWHWPMLAFTTYSSAQTDGGCFRAFLLVFSALLAFLSWKYIETPFRQRALCPLRSHVFTFAISSTFILLFFGGLICFQSRRSPKTGYEYYFESHNRFANVVTLEQAATGHFAELGAQKTNQRVQILLWGDSHAMAVAPALDALCKEYSVRGMEATHPATPPILDYSCYYAAGLNEKTPEFSKAVLEFIKMKHVEVVVIAALWGAYKPANQAGDKLVLTTQRILATGSKVYILKDVPMPGFYVPRLAALKSIHHGDPTKLVVSREKYDADNHDYDSMFSRLQQIGAIVLDTPKYFLNKQGGYDVFRHGQPLYQDDHHLNAEGSSLLLPMFEPIFKALIHR